MTREEFLNVALLQATEEGVGINLAKFAEMCIEWGQQHPMTYDGKAMLYVNNKSHENGYNEAVNKACKWLKNYAHIYVSETTGDLYEDDLINDFRKEMKGE